MSSCKSTWSLIVVDSPLTVVELSLILAGNSSTTVLIIVEASLAVIGELLIVGLLAVVAVGVSTVSADTLGTVDVSSSVTFEVALTVAGGPLFSISDEAPEPISSISMVFNGFYVPQITMDSESDINNCTFDLMYDGLVIGNTKFRCSSCSFCSLMSLHTSLVFICQSKDPFYYYT